VVGIRIGVVGGGIGIGVLLLVVVVLGGVVLGAGLGVVGEFADFGGFEVSHLVLDLEVGVHVVLDGVVAGVGGGLVVVGGVREGRDDRGWWCVVVVVLLMLRLRLHLHPRPRIPRLRYLLLRLLPSRPPLRQNNSVQTIQHGAQAEDAPADLGGTFGFG